MAGAPFPELGQMLRAPSLVPGALFLAGLALASPRADDPVDFERDIAPVLEERCFSCHGEKKQRAGLRLDSKTAALAGSDNGEVVVIVPGDAGASLLYELVASDDEDERMPPKGGPLTSEQIDAVRRWIDAGASWPDDGSQDVFESDHWAYRLPLRPELPAPRGAEWARGELDLFVLEKLEAAGLATSPEAERATLVRRLFLDLVGLPPSPAELAEFLDDERPDAYEHLVERLFASPHYGERMARGWLDLARYADTNGYEKDDRRTMWRYRDWVIEAFNADMGFDQFTIEQLAGDLLPEPTLEQEIATGFHRNTMVNAEGGVDPEEYRVAAVVDRVNTTASVWLGTTMNCVQCHTHKYDPFSLREFYRLFAYFNSTEDIGPSVRPMIDAPTREQAVAEDEAAREEAELEERLTTWTPELTDEFVAYRGGLRASRKVGSRNGTQEVGPRSVGWLSAAHAEKGTTLSHDSEDGSILATGELPASDTYVVEFTLPDATLRSLRVDVLTDESLPGGGPGRTQHGNFVLNEVTAQLKSDGETRDLVFGRARADHHQSDSGSWPPLHAIDGDTKTGWAIGSGERRPHWLELEFAEPVQVAQNSRLTLRLDQLYGYEHLIGRFVIRLREEEMSDALVAPPDIESWIVSDDGLSDPEQLALAQEWYLAHTPTLTTARDRLAELKARPRPATALVMRELDVPRESYVLERGSFLAPGERVEPGVPSVLNPLPADAPPNRLGFARWLVAPDNPLTARVTVNRLWGQVFGRGIVATPLDFGTQGEPPTHPELLDWLALEFQADGWSMKSLLRRIVTSSTYRQRSEVTPELLALDPDNRLLARSPRRRVEAEMVRDVALVASGLLAREVGGPSVMPPQPDGIWNMAYSGDRWQADEGSNRFRRGLYTFWRRTAPYPTFMAFDAPSRELCSVQRPHSNTPLQALALLNDPAFVEASIGLGARMLRAASDDGARLRRGFLLCTSREPRGDELEILAELLAGERERFAREPEAAAALLTTEVDLGIADLDPAELGAWTVVANVLLNLDETITRG